MKNIIIIPIYNIEVQEVWNYVSKQVETVLAEGKYDDPLADLLTIVSHYLKIKVQRDIRTL